MTGSSRCKQEVVELTRKTGTSRQLAVALFNLGAYEYNAGNTSSSGIAHAEALEIRCREGLGRGIGMSIIDAGWTPMADSGPQCRTSTLCVMCAPDASSRSR